MANYVKSTDFAAKDSLPKGDPAKKIVGSEIDHEFNSIEDSVRTKVDKVLGAIPDSIALLNAQGEVISGGKTLQDLLLEMLPVATVLPFAGTLTVPEGFLKCEGQAVSRNTYSRLFQQIGTTYGAGNGTTTFNLPSMGGRTVLGSASNWAVGSSGGSANRTLTADNIAPHEHKMFSDQDLSGVVTTVTGSGRNPQPTPGKNPGPITSNDYVARSGLWTNTDYIFDSMLGAWIPFQKGKTYETYTNIPTSKEANVGRTGRNRVNPAQPFSIMQPYIVMNYIIKY